jgi:hypothetical protein
MFHYHKNRRNENLFFFNRETDASYECDTMRWSAHCEINEAFKACENLSVGINYMTDGNLKMFPNSDLGLQDEDRKPFFLETLDTGIAISKKLIDI